MPSPLDLQAGQIALSLPGCRWGAPRTWQPCLWAPALSCLPYCARFHSRNTHRGLRKRQQETLKVGVGSLSLVAWCESSIITFRFKVQGNLYYPKGADCCTASSKHNQNKTHSTRHSVQQTIRHQTFISNTNCNNDK